MRGRFSPLRHGIPLMALAMLGFTGWYIAEHYDPRDVTAPPVPPPTSPWRSGVAGTGLIEPASELIALAIERGGVVSRVDVVVGAKVRAGQPLFAIDDRGYRALVQEGLSAVAAANAEIDTIDRSIALQQEIIAQAEAGVEAAVAERTRASLDFERYKKLASSGWTPRQRLESVSADIQKADAARTSAQAALAAARKQAEVLASRRHEANAKLAGAEAALEKARVDLDQTVVKAPIEGAILKVNVRLGEYAQPGTLAAPLMTMGVVDPLHVRVDIDEADAWRIRPEAPAVARLRGNASLSASLSFVRFEPYVLPKRALSGDTTERVDTRVLQAIYAFNPADFHAFVGQQVDVFVEAPALGASSAGGAATPAGAGDRAADQSPKPGRS
jgi:HlyD family secretion protein